MTTPSEVPNPYNYAKGLVPKIQNTKIVTMLTLKDAGGGGADSAHWSGDRLPFLTGSYYGHKNS